MYRDVKDLLGHVLTLGFFTTPVLYQLNGMPEHLRSVILWNPLASIFSSFHDCLFFNTPPNWTHLGIVAAGGLCVALAGYRIFESYRDVLVEEL